MCKDERVANEEASVSFPTADAFVARPNALPEASRGDFRLMFDSLAVPVLSWCSFGLILGADSGLPYVHIASRIVNEPHQCQGGL